MGARSSSSTRCITWHGWSRRSAPSIRRHRWELPEAFGTLRRLLEARMGKAGKREYVQVLRLLENFRLEDIEAAVHQALRLGAIGFDAIKHLVLCRIERRPAKLDLTLYPYLPRAQVATTSTKAYMGLLSGAAS